MAHTTLPLQDLHKLLMGDYGTFLIIKDWRLELKVKGQLSQFYEVLKSDSRKHLIEFLTYCEDKENFHLEETILTYSRGFQNYGYFRLTCFSAKFIESEGLIVFIRNISDEYQSYLRLMQIETNIKGFFEYSPIAFTISVDGIVSFLCPEMIKLSGFENYKAGRLLSHVFPVVAEQSASTIRRKRGQSCPTTLTTNKGASQVLDTYVHLVQERNHHIHLIAACEAQGGRKVENDLIRYLVGFKQIADNVPGVLFQVGIRSTGRVEFSYFSEGALDILDIQPSILRAQPEIILKFLSAEDVKKLKESFFDCAANNKVWEDEVVLKIAENCERWIRVRGTIQFSQGIFEISGIIHNITDEKKDLERQYLIKNRLLKIHSHDAIQKGLIEESYEMLSKSISECLHAERISFWYFDEKLNSLHCDFCYNTSDTLNSYHGTTWNKKEFYSFFKLIQSEQLITAYDAKEHSGLGFFTENIINAQNISAFVATLIIHNGTVTGVLLVDVIENIRRWESYEVQFIKNISDVLSYCRSINEKSIFEKELIYLNSHLSQLVQSRTEELYKKQEMLESKNAEVVSSLRYAKHIQSAILPHRDYFDKLFPQSFVMYQPKDIVAGDFFWAESATIQNKFGEKEISMVAACDCTGHGVPGAMMSMLASSALSRAIHQYSLSEPNDILYRVNQILKENMTKSKNEIFDGMDASLCVLEYTNYSKTEALLKFSGANSPIWIFRQNDSMGYEHIRVKGDKQSIGLGQSEFSFTGHEIPLKKGDIVYMFSDGFADQFGGDLGKKMKYRRMRDMLLEVMNLPMTIQRRCLEANFKNWRGSNDQIDDVLLIGFKV
jgi:serine phosphatase RsbU (regulator of sigma subunit)